MDSINQNQPENNRKNLRAEEAVAKIRELVEQAETCFFCTGLNQPGPFNTRPMTALKVDDLGNIWFLSAIDSHKNKDIAENPHVQLLFRGKTYSDFLSLSGEALLTRDQQIIKELWNPLIKTWFTEGQTDPRITVIKFVPDQGYYWDTKHGVVVSFAKQIAGAITGQTLDDSIEGSIFL